MNEWMGMVVVCCFRIEWLVTVVVLCVEMVHGSPVHHCAVSFAVSMVVSFCLFCFLCIFFTPVVSGHCFGVFVCNPALRVRCDRRIVCCRFSYTSTTRRHRRDNDYNGGGDDDGIVLLLFLFSLCLCCVLGPEYLARREFSIFLWVNLV